MYIMKPIAENPRTTASVRATRPMPVAMRTGVSRVVHGPGHDVAPSGSLRFLKRGGQDHEMLVDLFFEVPLPSFENTNRKCLRCI